MENRKFVRLEKDNVQDLIDTFNKALFEESSFQGTKCDSKKEEAARKLGELAVRLASPSDEFFYTVKASFEAPHSGEPDAHISLEFELPAIFMEKEPMNVLSEMFSLSDSSTMDVNEESGNFVMTFSVNGIWEE